MTIFNEARERNLERLELFIPVVVKVHGGSHPEFHDVKSLFDEINTKVNETEKSELNNEFKKLREITDNYKVPDDVCESYEAVYKMLEEIDEAYQGE